MSEKQRISRFTSKGGRQAGKQGAQRTLVRRLLLIWLAALTVAMAAPAAGAFAAPSNEDPTGGGSSLAGATSNLGQDSMTARASPDGAGAFSAWFTDPGEWYVASPAPIASNAGWNDAAGSYSALRLAAAGTGAASTTRRNDAAGSYSALRLAAAGTGAEVAGATRLDDAAGSYGELRLAASEAGADSASAWQEEYEWLVAQYGFLGVDSTSGSEALSESSAWQEDSEWLAALSDACAEPSDDPILGASSTGEAEFYDSQCSTKGAALLIGGGGSSRQ